MCVDNGKRQHTLEILLKPMSTLFCAATDMVKVKTDSKSVVAENMAAQGAKRKEG
jgi:hypothetical protein